MTTKQALAFVASHGVVLESGRGPVPNLAMAIAGEPIQGSWWAHPEAQAIFRLTRIVRASPEVLVCRLVDGKVTYVHRRLWPALVRMAGRFPRRRLAAIAEVHTSAGTHRVKTMRFPDWVPEEVRRAATQLREEEATSQLAMVFRKS